MWKLLERSFGLRWIDSECRIEMVVLELTDVIFLKWRSRHVTPRNCGNGTQNTQVTRQKRKMREEMR